MIHTRPLTLLRHSVACVAQPDRWHLSPFIFPTQRTRPPRPSFPLRALVPACGDGGTSCRCQPGMSESLWDLSFLPSPAGSGECLLFPSSSPPSPHPRGALVTEEEKRRRRRRKRQVWAKGGGQTKADSITQGSDQRKSRSAREGRR